MAENTDAGINKDAETDALPESLPEQPAKKPGLTKKLVRKIGLYLGLAGPKTDFRRLTTVHALSTMGDAMIILALSNSLFFSIDANAARVQVLLYLLLTMAPFTLVAPIIGPALDSFKRGRRTIVVIMNLLRTFTALLMIGRQDTLLLFPLAFLILVLGKSYSVAKASILPYTVKNDDELVQKNSRLAVLSGFMGFSGILLALPVNYLLGTSWVIGLAGITWALASYFSFRLPSVTIKEVSRKEAKRARKEEAASPEKRKKTTGKIFDILIGKTYASIKKYNVLATTATMGVLRAILGFMSFLIAFGFRGGTDEVDLSGLGKAIGAGVKDSLGFAVETDQVESPIRLIFLAGLMVVGGSLGSFLAPKLRRSGKEENIIFGGLIIIAMAGLSVSLLDTYLAGLCLGFAIGFSVSASKVGFDSVIHRNVDKADYGKSFGGFETFFQLTWVLGAIAPVSIVIAPKLGFFMVGITASVTWVFYMVKRKKSMQPLKPAEKINPPALHEQSTAQAPQALQE